MQIGSERVGPRGLALLGLTGLVGLGLALHGYGRGVVVAGAVGGLGTTKPAASGVVPTTTTKAHGPTTSALPSTSGAPASGQRPSSPGTTGGQKLGPLLSSTPYAPYAYQLYPGPESAQDAPGDDGLRHPCYPSRRPHKGQRLDLG